MIRYRDVSCSWNEVIPPSFYLSWYWDVLNRLHREKRHQQSQMAVNEISIHKAKYAQLRSSGMMNMKKPNTFWLNLRFSPQEKILVWYCRSSHKPWMGQSSVLQGNIYYGLVRFPFSKCFLSIYVYIHRLTNDTMLLSEKSLFPIMQREGRNSENKQ